MFLEKTAIVGDSNRATLGLILGFILALLLGGSGVWVVLKGQDIVGLSMIFVPLAALIGVFVNTQKTRKEEREARNQTRTEKTLTRKK